MPDRPTTTEKIKRLTLERAELRSELEEAREDLKAIKRGLWQMVGQRDFTPEELAVCLALVASIVGGWPRPYTPNVAKLAELSHTDEATVATVLHALEQERILHMGGTP